MAHAEIAGRVIWTVAAADARVTADDVRRELSFLGEIVRVQMF